MPLPIWAGRKRSGTFSPGSRSTSTSGLVVRQILQPGQAFELGRRRPGRRSYFHSQAIFFPLNDFQVCFQLFLDSDRNHVVICSLILRRQPGHSPLHSRHCAARAFSFTSFTSTSFASLTSSKPFRIRTYETPLPQPLYNPHLRAPLGSAGNKGLITPLESALTKNSPASRLESALTKRWGWGPCSPLRNSPLVTRHLLADSFGDSGPVGTGHPIHRDAAQELGIKVGGLLWQHFPGGGDLHDLLDIARIQQKRNLRPPVVHRLQRGRDFSFIRQVRFPRHRLWRDAQRRLQDSFVQQDHVEFALPRRNVRQQLRQVGALAQRQHVESPLLLFRGGIDADRSFLSRARESCKEFFLRFGSFPRVRKRKSLRREPRLQMPPHAAPGKLVNVGRDAVRGQNRQPFALRIDERHHDALVRRVRVDFSSPRAALVPVIQRGFVAVMPVGDHQLLAFHGFLDRRHALRLRDHPQPVHDAILVAQFSDGRGARLGLRQNRINAPLRIRIQHEKLARMHLCVPQKFQAVRLRPGKRMLVPENDTRRILLQFPRADESAARAAFFGARYGVFLRVRIKSRRRILRQDILANPLLQRRRRSRVNIILRRIPGISPAFLHGYQVVRVRGVIFFLHRRRNFVVGLRQDAVERGERGVVAKSAKGINLGHEFSEIFSSRGSNRLFYANTPQFRQKPEINFWWNFDGRLMTVEKDRLYYNSWFMTVPNFSSARVLIFDLDGTLIDSKRDLILSVNAMLRERGREELHEDTIAGYIGHGAPQLMRRALGNGATEEEREKALKFFLAHYEEHKLDSTCAYPGVPEALEQLAGFSLAVLTNKPVRVSIRILGGLGLAKYFRAVYGGNSFQTKKPDPLGVQVILREFGAAPAEAILIGDSEVDVQTARNAGTLAAAVNYGFGTHDRAAHPADIYLDRLTDLVPLLRAGREEANR